MTEIVSDRLEVLDALELHSGNKGMEAPCVMNVVDYITGGTGENDHPVCASRVITNFAIGLNDSLRFEQWRNELKPYITRIAGSNGTIEQEVCRAYAVSDWVVRITAPSAFETAELTGQVQALVAAVAQYSAALKLGDEMSAIFATIFIARGTSHIGEYAARSAVYATAVGNRFIWEESLKMLEKLLTITEEVE